MDDGGSGHHACQENDPAAAGAFREDGTVPVVMAAADAMLMTALVLLAVIVRRELTVWYPILLHPGTILGLGGSILLIPAGCWIAGLYPGYGLSEVDRLRGRCIVSVAVFGLMISFDYLAQGGQWSRGVLVIAAILWLLVSPLCDGWVRERLQRGGRWGMPVLVCGPAARRSAVVADLRRNPGRGYVPVAAADWPVDPVHLPGVKAVVLADPGDGSTLGSALDDLPCSRVILLPDFGTPQSQWVSVREVGSLLGLEMRRNLLVPANRAVKRAIDLLLAGLLAVPAVPVIAVCAVLVKIISPGPAFYYQCRDGCDGRVFRMWKIRTMVVDADQRLEQAISRSQTLGAEWRRHMKLRSDPRVLPGIGRFLRRWSLDELPQLWNVIAGDMSMSGPRPLPSYHLKTLPKDICRLRQKVRPGITGLVQISGRGSLTIEEQDIADVYYIRNWSLWLDAYIFMKTVQEIITGRGAY